MNSNARQKKSGVFYATAPDGSVLPIIDITHPSFAVNPSADELAALREDYLRRDARLARMPRWVQRLFYRFFLRKSVLAASLHKAAGGFLDGMSTYRLKLGPDNLDRSWASPIDVKIAESLPCLSMRLRLQDVAHFVADSLASRLPARPGQTLHLINIAGGPSMDSINALIVLQRRDRAYLRGHRIRIHVLDQDESGPAFANRAVAALTKPGGPLRGLDAALVFASYNWDAPERLRGYLEENVGPGSLAAVSTEGGLFDYGSDHQIRANLEALANTLPPGTTVAGTVTRADVPGRRSGPYLRFAIQPRHLSDFNDLSVRAGWTIARSITRPFSFSVQLQQFSA